MLLGALEDWRRRVAVNDWSLAVQALSEKLVVRITPSSRLMFPGLYLLFVTLAALDVVFTWWVLCSGGVELNPLAAWVIEVGGSVATVIYKFGLVLGVVLLCERIGRQDPVLARWVAGGAVALTALPVSVGAQALLSAAAL